MPHVTHRLQVLCRRLIKARDYDTSFKSMSRRAQRANSYVYRLAQTGGTNWKLLVFGEWPWPCLWQVYMLWVFAGAAIQWAALKAVVAGGQEGACRQD